MPGKNVLIMGATYGSLLASKLVLAGHNCTMVCLPAEADVINADGLRLRLPVRGVDGLVDIHSAGAAGSVRALGPDDANPADYDMVALAMQEPQYRLPGVRDLLARVAASGRPTMSIMNMPPLPYLARLPGVDVSTLRSAYADPTVWDGFDPANITLASPDPQAFKPEGEPLNVLQVSLPTNFKVAAFEGDGPTAMLHEMEADILAIRFDAGSGTDRTAGQVARARVRVRAAGQVGDAGHRQLPLRDAGWSPGDPRRGPFGPRRLGRGLFLGAQSLRRTGRGRG